MVRDKYFLEDSSTEISVFKILPHSWVLKDAELVFDSEILQNRKEFQELDALFPSRLNVFVGPTK